MTGAGPVSEFDAAGIGGFEITGGDDQVGLIEDDEDKVRVLSPAIVGPFDPLAGGFDGVRLAWEKGRKEVLVNGGLVADPGDVFELRLIWLNPMKPDHFIFTTAEGVGEEGLGFGEPDHDGCRLLRGFELLDLDVAEPDGLPFRLQGDVAEFQGKRSAGFEEGLGVDDGALGVELGLLVAKDFLAVDAMNDFLVAAHFHFDFDPLVCGDV